METIMKAFIVLCSVVSLFHFCNGFDREIHSTINPGCQSCNSKNITLLYVKSVGDSDVLHNIWDFTSGKPAIIFARTDLNATFNLSWQNTTPSYVEFSSKPLYAFGILMEKIWEYNDVNNTAVFDPNLTDVKSFDTKGMEWERTEIVQSEAETMVTVISKNYGTGENKRKGNIIIKLDLYPYTGYGPELPHLVHSANSTLMDFTFENMTETYNSSRFAVELTFISTEKVNGSLKANLRKGLDDEHTPGIFEIIDIVTPETMKNGDGGFVQFRPISYTDHVKDISASTEIHVGGITPTVIDNTTLAASMFHDLAQSNNITLVEKVFVSIGSVGDGFFKKTKYTTWSFTIGYGNPPMEGFSLFVILVISIGLGIPLLLLILGGIFVCVKRRKKLNHEPEILVEDPIIVH